MVIIFVAVVSAALMMSSSGMVSYVWSSIVIVLQSVGPHTSQQGL